MVEDELPLVEDDRTEMPLAEPPQVHRLEPQAWVIANAADAGDLSGQLAATRFAAERAGQQDRQSHTAPIRVACPTVACPIVG
jgi:hypothetical protein